MAVGAGIQKATEFVKGGPKKMQEMAMEQMMKQMMNQMGGAGMPGGASPFGAGFPGGAPASPFGAGSPFGAAGRGAATSHIWRVRWGRAGAQGDWSL